MEEELAKFNPMGTGATLVGFAFNPDGNMDSARTKMDYAVIIDRLHEKMHFSSDPVTQHLYQLAIDDAVKACMLAVKALTWS